MQSIVSGTSTERVVRTLLLMLLIDGFTVAYLWDGYVSYARQNATELARLLGLPSDAVPPINTTLTASEGQRMAQQIKPGGELSAITSVLGRPSLEHDGDAYFLGAGGWLKVQMAGDRIASVAWTNGPKTEADQRWQRWIGYALAVGGIIAAIQLVLVLSARLTLSDSGLQIGGRALIPFEAITALRTDPAGRSGCVELEYSLDGKSQHMRLDQYVFKRLPDIVSAICERKGFTNPRPAAKTEGGRA